MKHLLTIVLLLFLSITAFGQCPSGVFELRSQAEVDAVPSTYPGCTDLAGYLVVTSSLGPVTNVDSLIQFETISQDLYIHSNPRLKNLDGLQNLRSIGRSLRLQQNDSLTNLDGLSNLESVTREILINWHDELTSIAGLAGVQNSDDGVYIINNGKLGSLTGLEGIDSVEYLRVSACESLTDLSGLDNLVYVGKDLRIDDCDGLTSFNGLENLTFVGEKLQVEGNQSLQAFTGLENLTNIGGQLILFGHDNLLSLEALASVTSIGGDIAMYFNTVLPSLSGLHNADLSAVSSIDIQFNNALSFCATPNICAYMAEGTGSITLASNGSGCSSVAEVETNCDALPVTWVNDLSGSVKSHGIELSWAVTDQEEDGYFTVEHKTGHDAFLGIRSISQSEKGAVHKYKFVHESPLEGLNYYRVLYTTADAVEMSQVVALHWTNSNARIYPNPASHHVRIRTELGSAITIQTVAGMEVWSGMATGNYTVVDVSGWLPGTYIVITHYDGAVHKLIIN